MAAERLSERLREAIQSSWWDDVVDDVKAIIPALEELEAREERLAAGLKKDAIRLEILRGRMVARDDHDGRHDGMYSHSLSLQEIDDWVDESRAIAESRQEVGER